MTTETLNGKARGRVVPLPTHTFKDSGVTVCLHKLSPMTSQEIISQVRRELAEEEPQPPVIEVNYGRGPVQEANPGDPRYVERHQAWEQQVSRIANERLFKLAALDAVEIEIGDAERAQIAKTKRYLKVAAHVDWHDDPDLTPDENDQYFYVRHVACGSAEDIQEFYAAIATRSQPTEAAIERHKATFQGDIQGP